MEYWITKLREQGAADTSPAGRIEVEKAVVRAVDRLIAQCPAEQDELLADYGAQADQIALIPSAVDTDRYKPVARSAARRKLARDVVGRGRVGPLDHPAVLIHTFREAEGQPGLGTIVCFTLATAMPDRLAPNPPKSTNIQL